MDGKEIILIMVTAMVSCLATSIIKDIYDAIKRKTHKPIENYDWLKKDHLALKEDMNLLKESQKNQLWLSLTRTYNELMEKKYATDLEKAAFKASFESYSSLGGNHGMSSQYNDIMRLPANLEDE